MSRSHERHNAICPIICQMLTHSFRRTFESHHDTHQGAKTSLQSDIEQFISEKIILADKVMVKHAVSKIRDGDVLLTYGSSSAVEMLLLQAQQLNTLKNYASNYLRASPLKDRTTAPSPRFKRRSSSPPKPRASALLKRGHIITATTHFEIELAKLSVHREVARSNSPRSFRYTVKQQ
ncbi:hypothetical protein ACFX2G_004202 [Malus domestica]